MREREKLPAEDCIVGSEWADAFVQRFYGMTVEHNVGTFDPESSADVSLIRQWFIGAIEAGRTHGVRLERALSGDCDQTINRACAARDCVYCEGGWPRHVNECGVAYHPVPAPRAKHEGEATS